MYQRAMRSFFLSLSACCLLREAQRIETDEIEDRIDAEEEHAER